MRVKIDKMLAHVCLLFFKSVFFFLKNNKIKENIENTFGSHFYFVLKIEGNIMQTSDDETLSSVLK